MRRGVSVAAATVAVAALFVHQGDRSAPAPRALELAFDPPDIAATPREGACHAPKWLEANHGTPAHSDRVARGGRFSLALPVRFTGAHGEHAGIACVLSEEDPVDLTRFQRLAFHVFAPTSGLQADLAFNAPWRGPTTRPRILRPGWNAISYDLSFDGRDFPGGQREAREILVRLTGSRTAYRGRVHIDGIRLLSGSDPVMRLLAPQADDQVAGAVRIRARASALPGRRIATMQWAAAGASGAMRFDRDRGEWHATWDTGGDGVRRVAVSAHDSAGGRTSVAADVLVRNSAARADIVFPGFDRELRGVVIPVARLKGEVRAVGLHAGDRRIAPARTARVGDWQTVSFRLDTRALADGVHTLRVTAHDGRRRVADEADVIVRNHRDRWGIVRARGTRFEAGGRPFRFIGANQYDLFTRVDEHAAHVHATATGRVIAKGTRIEWREQIDRAMLEAARRKLTVLRTWAFGDGPEPFSLQPTLGMYRESAFRKLDYVLDSARRHRVRLILTLTNYPSDYGGVGFYGSELGLDHKNDFFRSARARRHYERYVAHVVRRVNTVNGIPYRRDPAIFAWELVNEPRMECHEDGRRAWGCDASGWVLRNWIARSAEYVKRLDPHHMVVAGVEGHGRVKTPSGPLQWSGRYEGNGNDPWKVQDVPGTDFLTIHAYPNEVGYDFTFPRARRLLAAIMRSGTERGKPVVMSEFGILRSLPVRDRDGAVVAPGTARHERVRRDWYRAMLAACYRNGCAGSNVWMLSDRPDPDLTISLSTPRADARRDAPIVALLQRWGRRLDGDAAR